MWKVKRMSAYPLRATAAGQPAGFLDASIAPTPRISLQAFCETAQTAAAVQAAAQDRRMTRAQVRVQMGGIAAAIEAFRDSPTPTVILLETEKRGEHLLRELDELAEVCDVATEVLIVGHVDDAELYRQVVRRGVNNYLLAPIEPRDVLRALSLLFRARGAAPLGRIVAVVGAKGGVGASTVAHNIAWATARDLAIDTVITDLDLPFGTASLDYNQDPPQDLTDAVSAPHRVDPGSIDRFFAKCADRLSLLAAPGAIDRVYDFAAESFDSVIDALRAKARCVVLDVPHIWTAWARRILVDADDILIVAAPELASLRNAKILTETLQAARPNDRRPSYCLNQVGVPERPEIMPADFACAIGGEPLAVISFEPQLFGAAAYNGQMIAEIAGGDRAADTFSRLARTFAGCAE